ncbi:MAG: NUDIX domain-containing protein [bacterium]|nr:NUDIX domain-containing protein [bacterium]
MPEEKFKLIPDVHIFLFRENQALLLRRFNTGYADSQYSIVAGHMDGNETAQAAAIREAREEAGIHIAPSNIEVVGVMHRKQEDERIGFILVAHTWKGEPFNAEPDKCDDLSWFSLDDLPENMVPYVRRALQNYQNGQWFDSFGWDTPKK